MNKLSANARAFLVDSLMGTDRPMEPKSQSGTVSVNLVDCHLWNEFHRLGTEMIITKAGRRMFPLLKIRLGGLEQDRLYLIYLEIDQVDGKRYRYNFRSSKWIAGGSSDSTHNKQRYIHPDGPQPGRFWNNQTFIEFDKLKLTNGRKSQPTSMASKNTPHLPSSSITGANDYFYIALHSMCKYQPKIYIQPIEFNGHGGSKCWSDLCQSSNAFCFQFPETQFITVTAYQNQQITRLKIASNPFAKGFRDSNKNSKTNEDVGTPELNPIRPYLHLQPPPQMQQAWKPGYNLILERLTSTFDLTCSKQPCTLVPQYFQQFGWTTAVEHGSFNMS